MSKLRTRQADFREVDAVGHHHEVADSFRLGLLPAQEAGALLVLRGTAERGYPGTRLEVKARARPHQVVCGLAVSETQLLTLF